MVRPILSHSICVVAWLVTMIPGMSFGARCQETAEAAKPNRAVGAVATKADLEKMRRAAIDYLKSHQADDGSFSSQLGPGVTCLVIDSMVRSGVAPSDPVIAKALQYVQTFVQPDGGIYNGPSHQNYETSIAVMCLKNVNQSGQYDETIAKAKTFLRKIQWNEDEQVESADPRYGGQGYGSGKRPDLSNTGMFIDALKAIDTNPDDPAIQEALKFISRTQNLDTSNNDTKFAKLINDGGFYYTPAGEGDSKAGVLPNGGLRSYGSMTYVGFKSLLYAGLDRNDIRVQAARDWIARNYTLDENPGVDQQGLYYYYHVFGKTFDAWGEEFFVDAKGVSHPWKQELIAALAKRQKPDGSWVNSADRWYEGDPNLVTAYALLALSYCD